MIGVVNQAELFATLPPPWEGQLRAQIRAMVASEPDHKLVVLDDDPTGTQTVYDVPVLTTWDIEALKGELAGPMPCFYVLTNSRSFAPHDAAKINREIARNLRAAVWQSAGFSAQPEHWRQLCCRAFTLVSRSDSTMRGHYPIETDVLAEELGPFDATILFPYLEAGGRYTINGTHYVAEGDKLVPAADTPFARDAMFGYRSSNLCEYVEEKTAGRVKAARVVSFSIPELRTPSETHEPTRRVFLKLRGLKAGTVAVVNACAPADAEFFAAASLCAEKTGGRYLFRTAAQFVAARLAVEPRPLWEPPVNRSSKFGGLIVVGSYVPKTSEQLQSLLDARPAIAAIELPVTDLSQGVSVVTRVNELLSAGRDVLVFTSRQVVRGATAAESLDIGNRVSTTLVEIIRRVEVQPRYLVAKGGITSSDLATRGLGVKRAMVRGQLLPGVPVWELGEETKFPGMPYIVFPGNVGGPSALINAIQKLKPSQ
jgi:uncharacterized protein YgbK (DUF1537 family)